MTLTLRYTIWTTSTAYAVWDARTEKHVFFGSRDQCHAWLDARSEGISA